MRSLASRGRLSSLSSRGTTYEPVHGEPLYDEPVLSR